MNVAIIGYGKMGKTIEQVLLDRGHTVIAKINDPHFSIEEICKADVAIEFSQPEMAAPNIETCFEANVPVVVGTTGWYDSYEGIKKQCLENNKSLFTATNFSIGVNILFHLNEKLAQIMNSFPAYDVSMEEIHHLEKKDHPSGTACTLASDIVNSLDRKNKYVGLLEGQEVKLSPFDLQIESKRQKGVPGFHKIDYTSPIDQISISHNANNRMGFAQGAVVAAEWLEDKKGVFTMKDLLNF